MDIRKGVIASLWIAMSAAALPSLSVAGVMVDINVAPPAPRVEVLPPPRAGFVWAPGFWGWRHGHHVWVGGHWVRERRGFHWVPDGWVQVGPRWHYAPGHWVR